MVFLFSSTYRQSGVANIAVKYALPLGQMWAFLGLTRLIYNFGGEGEGMQFYFLSPTPVRTIVLGKNALHAAVFALEAALISGMILFRFGWPAPSVFAATVAWILFALPVDPAAGNTLSVTMPYKAKLRGCGPSGEHWATRCLSRSTQLATFGIGAAVVVPVALLGRPWMATPVPRRWLP